MQIAEHGMDSINATHTHTHTCMHVHISAHTSAHLQVAAAFTHASERRGRHSPEGCWASSFTSTQEHVRNAVSVPGPNLPNQSLHFAQHPQVMHLHLNKVGEAESRIKTQLNCPWGSVCGWLGYSPRGLLVGTNRRTWCLEGRVSR